MQKRKHKPYSEMSREEKIHAQTSTALIAYGLVAVVVIGIVIASWLVG